VKIAVGQIYIVESDNFTTSGRSNKFGRPITLKKNELIEIRYPFNWHFRTLDNHYLHAESEDIKQHCRLFAVIWSDVRFNNKCNLSDIINLSLCDFKDENNYVWAKNFDYEYLSRMKLKNLLSSFEEKHKNPND